MKGSNGGINKLDTFPVECMDPPFHRLFHVVTGARGPLVAPGNVPQDR